MVRSGKGAPAVRDLQGSAPSLFIIRLSWAARIAWFLFVVALSFFLMLAIKWFIAPIPIYLLWKFIWAPLNRSFADAENQERAKAHPQMVDVS